MTARACRRTVSKSGAISAVRSARLSPAASARNRQPIPTPAVGDALKLALERCRPEDAVALIRKAVAVKPG